MPKKQPSYGTTPINSVKHQDKRANIPTEELRGFVADDEKKPKIVKYQRDESLDPQLVWQGKDEQDSQDLEVPAVPIYIQEKIHPHAIIEDFRQQAKQDELEQLGLFASDFNGLEFDKLIEFYEHKDGLKWSNRMILGDSLLVMNSLAEKEGLKGKVQMIYLDPPYGIKFGSNWQVSTRKRDVKDGKVEDVTRQPEQIRAFRDTWEKGIHSYLAYLRDRLVVARELLTETGSIFVQIGDENVHLVRCLMDEIFGSENFVTEIVFLTTTGRGSKTLDKVYDSILWYGKKISDNQLKFRQLFSKFNTDQLEEKYQYIEDDRRFTLRDSSSQGETDTGRFAYQFQRKIFSPPAGRHWSTTKEGLDRLNCANYLHDFGKQLRIKRYQDNTSVSPIGNLWTDTQRGSFQDSKIYVVQTHTTIIERCLLMTTDPGDLVLDPTCGSGTTAYVAEQWGRRWITIDTSRVALALARTRLMAARFPYYLLADSPEGRQKEQAILGVSNVIPANFGNPTPKAAESPHPASGFPLPTGEGLRVRAETDIKKGFVYKRVPHVTLKAIANNPEIDTIHEQWQQQLEPLLDQLSPLLAGEGQGVRVEEWQIPREPDAKCSQPAKDLLAQWWNLRQQRQREIDEAIARHADTEMLYDQPYEDAKRLRVTGPFTVESLSPHRVLAAEEARPTAEADGQQQASDQFETHIIENLRKAGVQNTIKQERLQFDSLEPHAGIWIHAVGEYTDADGQVKRVAVHLGPEYGTVTADDIKEAAKEAVQGIGYNLLIICGFAFDASVSEETRRYGKLTVLPTRMNADLLLGDELLKKTNAANLFMVFGEPDLEIQPQPDGKIVVQLNGLDIYDPTTGEIRSHSTDDIACWFIDTNYNGESFFVRHAYFTGADQPYDKLKRALKADTAVFPRMRYSSKPGNPSKSSIPRLNCTPLP